MRADNLSTAPAVEFRSDGTTGGTIITKAGDGSKPFVTNATGVATGVNADRVDDKNAATSSRTALRPAFTTARVGGVGAMTRYIRESGRARSTRSGLSE